MESRNDCCVSTGDGERTVLRSDGGCVNNGSLSSYNGEASLSRIDGWFGVGSMMILEGEYYAVPRGISGVMCSMVTSMSPNSGVWTIQT